MGTGYIIRRGLATALEETGEFSGKFIDYDGTLLRDSKVDSGGSVTPLTAPTHAGLTFQEWTHATSNVTSNMNVGATYITTDGKTHFGLRVTVATSLNVVLYLNKSDGSTLTVDWGDGSANSTFTDIENFNTGTHTYTNYGDYEVKMWISDGIGTYGFGNGTTATIVVGGDTQTQRDMLLYAFVGESVTSIGDNAFSSCSSLRSITIPNSVTSIGDNAFHNCTSLTNIIIPNSVTSIGDNAFYRCYSLTSITIPNSVTSIGTAAFFDCRSLTNITILNSVTSIATYAFSNCRSLTNITIPSSVTSIGEAAFLGCENLISVTIPNSVTSIEDYVFHGCKNLTSITIPNNVTSIGDHAFFNCKSLTIYAEASNQPKSWSNNWNVDNRPVIWNYKQKSTKNIEENVSKKTFLNVLTESYNAE